MYDEKWILEKFKESNSKTLKFNDMINIFNVDNEHTNEFTISLNKLIDNGEIFKNNKNKYGLISNFSMKKGIFSSTQQGFGFLMTDDENEDDYFIAKRNRETAMNGDEILVKIISNVKRNVKSEAVVLKVLKRKNKNIVGTFQKRDTYGFVVPDDKKEYFDIFVPGRKSLNANNNEKVVVEIEKYYESGHNPEGKIIEILGNSNSAEAVIKGIMYSFNLSNDFPENVKHFTKNIPQEIKEDEISKRYDFRDKITFTIDGSDAKDLDDAVSLEIKENGNYYLGVHIADVGHYVKRKNPIDIEAFKRGTSVYLADRVIPMIPKELSNGICSLNPNVDRLCLSIFMEINKSGKVIDHIAKESVINSNFRMTYNDCNKILENKDSELIDKYSIIIDTLKKMESLAHILRNKRKSRGSIDFDFPEAKIAFDDNNYPNEIKIYERGVSNRIIEEFMLLCNETVAQWMFWAQIPFVYRIHEKPSEDKIYDFNRLLSNLGYNLKGKNIHPMDFQKLLDDIAGKDEEIVISTMMLRSLMKAKYSSENKGHFGLASKFYCHFTSPIRRYPDLTIHRIIKDFVNEKINDNILDKLEKEVEKASINSSECEVIAQKAERKVEDYYKAVYMQDKIGNEFTGIVSSITSFGFFVELSNTIEGLVRLKNEIMSGLIDFDSVNLKLVSSIGNEEIKVGDKINVILTNVSLDKAEIDFKAEGVFKGLL